MEIHTQKKLCLLLATSFHFSIVFIALVDAVAIQNCCHIFLY